MICWRIGTETVSYPARDLSGQGAAIHPGRWNDKGEAVVYAAETRSLCVLETAAHVDASGFPLNRFLVEIRVPDELWEAREIADAADLDPAWSAIPAGMASARHGSAWLLSKRSLLLLVPSVIVPEESVVLINPAHADASRVSARVIRKFEYDLLFRR